MSINQDLVDACADKICAVALLVRTTNAVSESDAVVRNLLRTKSLSVSPAKNVLNKVFVDTNASLYKLNVELASVLPTLSINEMDRLLLKARSGLDELCRQKRLPHSLCQRLFFLISNRRREVLRKVEEKSDGSTAQDGL